MLWYVCALSPIYSKKYYNEAIVLLNKALGEEKAEPGIYINRGGELSTQAGHHTPWPFTPQICLA